MSNEHLEVLKENAELIRCYNKQCTCAQCDLYHAVKWAVDEIEQLHKVLKESGKLADKIANEVLNIKEENEKLRGALEEVCDGTSDAWIIPIVEKALGEDE